MEKIKLFVVQNDDVEIEAIFSTAEKAVAFNQRFPGLRKVDYHINEWELDPEFITFPDKSPFAVTIDANGENCHINILAGLDFDQDALDESTYQCFPFKGYKKIHLFAKDKEEAQQKALEIRDRLIQNGEW